MEILFSSGQNFQLFSCQVAFDKRPFKADKLCNTGREVFDFEKIYPVFQTYRLFGAKSSNCVNCSGDMEKLNCNFAPPGLRNMTIA